MKNLIIVIVAFVGMFTQAQEQFPYKLTKVFDTDGFEAPESVVKDPVNNVLYVSNVNGNPTDKDGNGYISKVGLDGKMVEKKWVDGLNAPKGMSIYKGKLYVADIDEIIEINIKTKRVQSFQAPEATFLNDVTADIRGNVYASNTFGFSGIYKLSKKGKVSLWMKDDKLNMPNGLLMDKKDLYVANWGIDLNPETYATKTLGSLLKVNIKDKTITTVTQPIGNLDGLQKTVHGHFITDWLSGKLLYLNGTNNQVSEALDLPKGSADIGFDKASKMVYIPLMLDGKVLAYKLSK